MKSSDGDNSEFEDAPPTRGISSRKALIQLISIEGFSPGKLSSEHPIVLAVAETISENTNAKIKMDEAPGNKELVQEFERTDEALSKELDKLDKVYTTESRGSRVPGFLTLAQQILKNAGEVHWEMVGAVKSVVVGGFYEMGGSGQII